MSEQSNDGEPLVVDISLATSEGDIDITTALRKHATGADLFELIERKLLRKPAQLRIDRTGEVLYADTVLTDVNLLRGDNLSASSKAQASSKQSKSVVLEIVDAVAGQPSQVELPSGVQLGRQDSWVLDHAGVSRAHFKFETNASGTSIEDLASINGTWVNGSRIERPTILRRGDRIEAGPTAFEFVAGPSTGRELEGGHLLYNAGRLDFTRPPRLRSPAAQSSFSIGEAPDEPPKRRFPYSAALLPVVFGAIMVFAFNSWIFAVFMAMGPVMVGWNYFEDKRSGRLDFKEAEEAYRKRLAGLELEVADSHAKLVAARRARVPGTPDLLAWATSGATEVWSRRPSDDDFLRLAPGDTDQPTRLSVTIADRGSDLLVGQATALRDKFVVDRSVPVEINADGTVMGITGAPESCAAIARSLLAQACVLQSHRDLVVAIVAPAFENEWAWSKWLPHVDPDLDGDDRLLGLSESKAKLVFADLQQLLELRVQASSGEHLGGNNAVKLPHVVVVIQPPAQLRSSEVQRFIEDCGGYGFTIIYLADDRLQLPGKTSVVVEAHNDPSTADVEFTDSGMRFNDVATRTLSITQANDLARNLAPLVDITAQMAGAEIPKTTTLSDLVDPESLSVQGIERAWNTPGNDLLGVIGTDPDGVFELDLKKRGPHGLVAGTTGAGKSELLQTMVVGLAIRHSPRKLNFIFIDYKANKIFQDLSQLPHTVGLVTNLDRRLVDRSIESLEAELKRRQILFLEQDANDLTELRNKNLAVAPPHLYIIVDEFAALKTDAPEFLDRLVDIAQRGRSMGVHMVLATQKPAGIIPDQIEGNINVRMALRVASTEDSRAVIGSPRAAEVPDNLPGRTFVKIGGGTVITELQAAYMGAQSLTATTEIVDDIQLFEHDSNASDLRHRSQSVSGASTDCDVLIDRVQSAWQAAGSPELHLPWAPPLPESVDLAEILRAQGPGSDPILIPCALADYPKRQQKEPWSVDIAHAGNVAIYGMSGSGKTTLLRTIAASIAARSQTTEVAIYGIDFGAGGLQKLSVLPHVGDVIAGVKLERVEQAITLLESELAQRRQLITQHPAGRWSELMPILGERCPPYWIIMIDGFAGFWAAVESLGIGGSVGDRFMRLFSECRSVGIHFVVTADQRSAIPHQLLGSIGLRVVQRLTSDDEYASLDVREPPTSREMPPGRTIDNDGIDLQCGILTWQGDSSAAGQSRALERLAERLEAAGITQTAQQFAALGATVDIDQLPAPSSISQVAVGLTAAVQPAFIDFARRPAILVVGQSGSGRSTALGAIARQVRPHVENLWLVAGKATSPLVDSSLFDRQAVRDHAHDFLTELADRVDGRAAAPPQTWDALVIDDAELYFDSRTTDVLDRILYACRDARLVFAVSAPTFQANTFDPWVRTLRRDRHAIALQPDPDQEGDLFDGINFPRNSAAQFPPGRGYYLDQSQLTTIHTLTVWDSTA